MLDTSANDNPELDNHTQVAKAALIEAARHVDIVHTSLVGMFAIVTVLLGAIALPVFGYPPVTNRGALIVMALASVYGVGHLYWLNYRVHRHIFNQARLTEVLVNSLGQGFLVFDRKGTCGSVYSQACLDLLETVPAGKNIADVLRIPHDQRTDFDDWFDVLFHPSHALGFDDVMKFLPHYFAHSKKRRVSLVYRPIHDQNMVLINVVVIATDETEEYEAHQKAVRQQVFADMICRIFKERNQFQATLTHIREFLDAADAPTATRHDAETFMRQLHTLQAAVKHFNLLDLGDIIHQFENDLRSPSIDSDESFVKALQEGRQKVADALLIVTEDVKDLIGGEKEWHGHMREIDEDQIYAFARDMQTRKVDGALIQLYLDKIAAVPIQDCFHSFGRELQELAVVIDKQIKPMRFTGENPRVLTRPIKEFLFSLTHICRNIVDHGIETPVTRMSRGKDPAGQVDVHAEVIQQDGTPWLKLIISDDGNGIDPSRVRAKLASIDPQGVWCNEDDQTVIQRIFTWGFTTSDAITALSGRGVGMEAVEREIKLLGGTIHVTSKLYQGAAFEIRIPYYFSIIAHDPTGLTY